MNNAVDCNREGRRDKLFNFRPALFAAFFLAGGILFSYYRMEEGISLWWLCALLPVAALPLAFCGSVERLYKTGIALLLLIGVAALGFLLFRSQVYAYTDCPRYQGEVTVTGEVYSTSRAERYYQVTLTDISVDGKEVDGRLNAYLPLSYVEKIEVADRVLLKGNVTTDVATQDDWGFRAYRIGNGTRYSLSASEGWTTGRSNNPFLLLRSRMERVIYAGMDDTSASVTLALLTGDTSGMERGLEENMRAGGISHVFAVSGLNVGAVYLLVLFFLRKTPLRRRAGWVKLLCLALPLFFYAGVCGFTPSVMRATLLCIFAYCARAFQTKGDLLNTLGLSACILLLFAPTSLFEAGFQLSYLACFGLVLLSKRIGQVCDEGYLRLKKLFGKGGEARTEETEALSVGGRVRKWTVATLSCTLAAQIFTAPALLMRFGFLSGWTILLNLFFVPILDGLFTLLLVTVAIACLLPLAWSVAFLFPFSAVWSALLLLFQTADFSTFALTGGLSAGGCVCYYLGLTFLSDKWNVSRFLRAGLAIGCFIGFLASFLVGMG